MRQAPKQAARAQGPHSDRVSIPDQCLLVPQLPELQHKLPQEEVAVASYQLPGESKQAGGRKSGHLLAGVPRGHPSQHPALAIKGFHRRTDGRTGPPIEDLGTSPHGDWVTSHPSHEHVHE